MKKISIALTVMTLVILTGCGLFSPGGAELPPPTDLEPGNFLFADDFTEDEFGAAPSKWTLIATGEEGYGTIRVIEEEGVPSGRAVHFKTDLFDGSAQKVQMSTPLFGEEVGNARVIAFEYWLHWVNGNAIYHYITKGQTHATNIQTSNNNLRTRFDGKSPHVTHMNEGWNHIRVLADIEESKMVFYVNDMDTPVPGAFDFLNPLDSWDGARFFISHETNKDEHREAYYADFKIWVVE